MKQFYTPDLYIQLRHGGTIDLSVCREDKIEIIRSVARSLNIDAGLKRQIFDLCDAMESDRTPRSRSRSLLKLFRMGR